MAVGDHAMVGFVKTAGVYGVNIPLIIGFLAGSILAICGNFIVFRLHRMQIQKLFVVDDNTTEKAKRDAYDKLLGEFDMRFAGLIGKTERILYVYSVMLNQFSLLGGWLVMKAFFGWLTKPRSNPRDGLPYYHLYLYGNALSILCGLLCGSIGDCVRTAISVHFASP